MHRTASLLVLWLAACGPSAPADAGTDAPIPDAPPVEDAGPPGASPVISMVAWSTDPACVLMTPSDYQVVTTVTDADTPAAMLTFEGSVEGCPPGIASADATIRCPNLAPYAGNLTVTDPEGHVGSITFVIAPCTDGSAEP